MKILSITKQGQKVDPKTIGLGDVAEKAFKPIAKALRLDCIDKDHNLKPQSPCAKRKDAWNKIRLPISPRD